MPKTELDRVKVKTLDSQFEYILKELFEYSPREAKAIVEAANEVYQLKHYDPSYHESKDKIVKTVISKKASHGPVLEDLPKVQVTLTKSITKEDKTLFRIENKSALRRVKILRMTEESLDQGGLLTQEDLADILQVSTRTIRRDIKKLKAQDLNVPTRGTYQDIGPGISHKTKIIKLYLEYNTYSEIQRKTRHSPGAIKRYINDFGRVLLAIKNKLSIKETAHIVGISERLVKEYTELYFKYNSSEYKERLADIVELEYKYHPRKKTNQFGSLSWVATSEQNNKTKLGQKREEYKQEVIELPYVTEEDIELKRQNVSKTEHDISLHFSLLLSYYIMSEKKLFD